MEKVEVEGVLALLQQGIAAGDVSDIDHDVGVSGSEIPEAVREKGSRGGDGGDRQPSLSSLMELFYRVGSFFAASSISIA